MESEEYKIRASGDKSLRRRVSINIRGATKAYRHTMDGDKGSLHGASGRVAL